MNLKSFFYFNSDRVRYAAINALGQLSTDLADEWQEEQHAVLVPILLKCMEDTENRVRGHATSALINFSEGCPEEIIVEYLDEVSKGKQSKWSHWNRIKLSFCLSLFTSSIVIDDDEHYFFTYLLCYFVLLQIISKLLTLLHHNCTNLVLETALQALSSVADRAEEQFKKYYSTVIPLLKHILATATSDEQRMIRAKALECVSLIGMAVGKDQFRDDAKAVMQLLITMDQENTKTDDQTLSFKLQVVG